MFAVHVDTVMDLRTALLPLVHMSRKADLKCSSDKLSITVVPDQFPFVVSLHLAPSFFTSFQFLPEGDEFEEYSSRFFLDLFISNLSNVPDDSITMTMFLRAHPGIAPLKFVIPSTGYLQYSALVLSPPLNIVRIKLTKSKVKISAQSGEVVLKPKNKQCVIGGVTPGATIQFEITLDPTFFFFHLTYLSRWVWLFKTVSSRSVLSFCTELESCYLVCF
ncbi:uncharacterized protein LOC111023073 isoform X3 [Momordica charantia]|uniref:Uncharacterized protein LOC111023073 isoform X3 n=1 Tax=Momordica charantia TaxID=3673 RepID=A0A6J1DR53_MOMCH|nr:uncharacterized protein LOC111023073 isoform X3 [Momordica charantia]